MGFRIALAFFAFVAIMWHFGVISGPNYATCIDAGHMAIDCAQFPDAPKWAKEKAAF